MPSLDKDYTHAVIPASPGYWLYFVNREEDPPIWRPRAAIVAWVIQYERAAEPHPHIPNSLLTYATPVLSTGLAVDREYLIEQPDGSIVRPDGDLESGLVDAIEWIKLDQGA